MRLGKEAIITSESKKREVLQLLKEYRAFWTPFGGSMPLDETGVLDAAYGPGGFVEAGMYYRDGYKPVHAKALADSYKALQKEIDEEKRNPLGMAAWLLLHEPYFGDPGDPTVVPIWREAGDYRINYHDVFVERLRRRLASTELHPLWPKPLSEREEKEIENTYAEMYAVYQRIRVAGNPHDAAVEQTAAYFSEGGIDLSRDAVERVIEFRETLKPLTCKEVGCDRKPERGTLCMKHYMQERRRSQRSKRKSEAC